MNTSEIRSERVMLLDLLQEARKDDKKYQRLKAGILKMYDVVTHSHYEVNSGLS